MPQPSLESGTADYVLPSPPPPPLGGLRYNSNKARYDLLPPDALEELVAVYTMGAEKYAPRNWEKGLSWMGCFASLMRHAWAWARGEDVDPESGRHHMAHVAWNAIALVAFSRRKTGVDDRPAVDEG